MYPVNDIIIFNLLTEVTAQCTAWYFYGICPTQVTTAGQTLTLEHLKCNPQLTEDEKLCWGCRSERGHGLHLPSLDQALPLDLSDRPHILNIFRELHGHGEKALSKLPVLLRRPNPFYTNKFILEHLKTVFKDL